ncbi:hypothetical protein KI387_000386, partial [Taxus chinensis]
ANSKVDISTGLAMVYSGSSWKVVLRVVSNVQVIVSGKFREHREKSMKFKDGYMISFGHPVNEYIDKAVRHVLLRQHLTDLVSSPLQGTLGIK